MLDIIGKILLEKGVEMAFDGGRKIAHEIAIENAREEAKLETKIVIGGFAIVASIIGLITAWLIGASLFSGATIGALLGVILSVFIS